MTEHNIPALAGIDTRALTRRTREQMGEPLYSDLDYYERSTESMKMILLEKGFITEDELEARMKDIEKRMAEARG